QNKEPIMANHLIDDLITENRRPARRYDFAGLLVAFILGLLMLLAAMVWVAPAHAGGHCFAPLRVVHGHAFHHGQSHYVAPQVNYFVGAPIRVEAIVQKALRDDPEYAEFKRFKQWQAGQANQQTVAQAPALPPPGNVDSAA